MKSRLYRRVYCAVFIVVLTLNSSIVAAPPRDREARTPRERIVRLIKEIKKFFTPVIEEDGAIPPKPTGP